MNLENAATGLIEWEKLETGKIDGEEGSASWKEFNTENMRIRVSEYSANYKTGEWCEQGHIIHCLKGEITLHFKNGSKLRLIHGNSAVIAEGDHHKAATENLPAMLFVLD